MGKICIYFILLNGKIHFIMKILLRYVPPNRNLCYKQLVLVILVNINMFCDFNQI